MRSSTTTASSSSACSAPPLIDDDVAETPRDGKITGFARIGGRDVGVVVNDFTTKGASTSATNSKKMGYIRKVCTERGLPFVHVGESTGARLPDAMGSKGHGQSARQRHHAVPPYARYALGRGRARHRFRVLRVAVLLRRLRRHEEGLDHVGVEPAPGLDGDRREGRSGRARRLAAACRADRAHRSVRRHRRAKPWRCCAASFPICRATTANCRRWRRWRKARAKRRSASSTSCRKSAPRFTT